MESNWVTIVGVVGDVQYRRLPENPNTDPDVYVPFGETNQQVAIAIRAAVPPASLVAATRAAIRGVDRSIVVYEVAPMSEVMARWTAPSRFLLWLMSVFAAIALCLAAIGIYGVMSYLVNQRTREIGVRMALGADSRVVLGLMLRQSTRPIGIGLGFGLLGAIAAGRYLQSLLFDVAAVDVLTLVSVSLLFGTVATLASCLPSYRATKVAPLIAIRAE